MELGHVALRTVCRFFAGSDDAEIDDWRQGWSHKDHWSKFAWMYYARPRPISFCRP
jgi:hypothetical protein